MRQDFSFFRFCWITLLCAISMQLSFFFDSQAGVRMVFLFSPGVLLGLVLVYGDIYALCGLSSYLLSRQIDYHWELPLWAQICAGLVLALHAALGARLIRRYVGDVGKQLPSDPLQILKFFVLGAVPAGMLATALGVLTWTMVGHFSWDTNFHPFIAWGLSSVGGTVAGSTLVLVILNRVYSWRHKAMILVPIVLMVGTVRVVVFFADSYYTADREYVVAQHVARIQAVLESELRTVLAVMPQVASYVENSPKLTEATFQRIASSSMQEVQSVYAIGWSPRITDQERQHFETALSNRLKRPLNIWLPDQHGKEQPVGQETEYFPVEYSYSVLTKPGPYGMNVAADPKRKAAIARARDSGTVTLTRPVAPIRSTGPARVIAYYPVYDDGDYTTQEERRSHLRGIVSAVIDISGLMLSTLESVDPGCRLTLVDGDGPDEQGKLFSNLPSDYRESKPLATVPVLFHGGHWLLSLYPSDDNFGHLATQWRHRMLLGFQVAVLFLTSAFALMVVGHSTVVDALCLQLDRRRMMLESRTAAILESIVDGVLIVDAHGRVVKSNSVLRSMTGQQEQQLQGRSLVELLTPEHAPAVDQAIQNVVKEQAVQTLGVSDPFYLLGPDNNTVPVEIVLSPFHDIESTISYVVVVKDMTTHLALEQAQIDREVAVRAADSKGRFMGMIGHELRTPLNAILGYSDLLIEDDTSLTSSDRQEYYEKIGAAGRNLLHRINSVMEITKADCGPTGIKPENFSPQELAQDLQEHQQTFQFADDCSFSLRCTAGEEFRTDVTRLRESILHLMTNAVKFTERGSIDVTLESVQQDDQQWLQASVRDTGVGIDESHLERIFEPFYQIDSSATRKYEGIGVGLYLARAYTRSMGGELTVESKIGAGSTFTIRVPKL